MNNDLDRPGWADDEHHHYRRFRAEHERQLDAEYDAWRRSRFDNDFAQWRAQREVGTVPPAPNHDGPLRSLGRAISEVVTGTRAPDTSALPATEGRADLHDAGSQRAATATASYTAGTRPAAGGEQDPELARRAQGDRFFERA